MNYTPEQAKEIQERVDKANTLLKELQLIPSCQIYYVNTGNDTFATKLNAYLQDTKYQEIISPIQKNELNQEN